MLKNEPDSATFILEPYRQILKVHFGRKFSAEKNAQTCESAGNQVKKQYFHNPISTGRSGTGITTYFPMEMRCNTFKKIQLAIHPGFQHPFSFVGY